MSDKRDDEPSVPVEEDFAVEEAPDLVLAGVVLLWAVEAGVEMVVASSVVETALVDKVVAFLVEVAFSVDSAEVASTVAVSAAEVVAATSPLISNCEL